MSSPLKIALLTGLASSSYTLFGNLGCTTLGILPWVLDRSSSLTPRQRLEGWKRFFDAASVRPLSCSIPSADRANEQVHMVGTSVLSSISFGTAAFLSHRSPSLASLTAIYPTSHLAMAASLAALTILPYTAVALLPTIARLQAIAQNGELAQDKGSEKESKAGDAAKGEEVMALIQTWNRRHLVRYTIFASTWALGVAAVLQM